jgi:hypothetical protein
MLLTGTNAGALQARAVRHGLTTPLDLRKGPRISARGGARHPSPAQPPPPWSPASPRPSLVSSPCVCRTSGSPRVGKWLDGGGPTSPSQSSGRPHRASRRPARALERHRARRCARPSQHSPSEARSRTGAPPAPWGGGSHSCRRVSWNSWSASRPPGAASGKADAPARIHLHAPPPPSRQRHESPLALTPTRADPPSASRTRRWPDRPIRGARPSAPRRPAPNGRIETQATEPPGSARPAHRGQ